ncbi:guanine deaminase [Roseibium sp. RKSG952]|uniref:guanine deaminase n=1 Tax=Roseibium sp. RKSG952 TaxID=2529384 RepID=UPI0012BCE272|nr:guanine deaminase [Roseibium sp. RKSG952]MTH98297.1 guanine deaminase [Roseibium sp. RKSG952]
MKGIRGTFLDFLADPYYTDETEAIRYLRDGLLVIDGEKIKDFGPWEQLSQRYPDLEVTTYKDRLILPGLIDTHIHYPQTEMVAAYGEQLLEWLEKYIFPTELQFRDKLHARKIADVFLDLLLANGTTTAQVFTTTFAQSVDAFFEACTERNICMIAGLTGMDRPGLAPEEYLDTAETFYVNSKDLIERWHNKGRNKYAISPRFALGSTQEQLDCCGKLKGEYPDTWVNTHMSENRKEIAQVAEVFPDAKDYLNVYERAGIVGPKFTAGHSIHLDNDCWHRMAQSDASVSFCPASNLFLGSGLFLIEKAKSVETPVRTGLGTDMGAGDTFSIFRVLNSAYKVSALQNQKMGVFKGLYLATLGGAKSLHLDHEIGSFDPGKFADFIVTNPKVTSVLAMRAARAAIDPGSSEEEQARERLAHEAFGMMILGDERPVEATYISGQLLYKKTSNLIG